MLRPTGWSAATGTTGWPASRARRAGRRPRADIFVFARAEASPDGRCDRLAGCRGRRLRGAGTPGGDRIDLRGIDADVIRSGDQTFVFGAGSAAGGSARGDATARTLVCGSADRDDRPEFVLEIADGAVGCGAYGADDFLLEPHSA